MNLYTINIGLILKDKQLKFGSLMSKSVLYKFEALTNFLKLEVFKNSVFRPIFIRKTFLLENT